MKYKQLILMTILTCSIFGIAGCYAMQAQSGSQTGSQDTQAAVSSEYTAALTQAAVSSEYSAALTQAAVSSEYSAALIQAGSADNDLTFSYTEENMPAEVNSNDGFFSFTSASSDENQPGAFTPVTVSVQPAAASETLENSAVSGNTVSGTISDTGLDLTDQFSNRDLNIDWDLSEAASITLSDSGTTSSTNAVSINGDIITITDEGTYYVTGSLSNGMLIVNADKSDKVRLILDGVSVHSETSAAVYVLQADKVFLSLADGSSNELSAGNTFTAIDENNIDAAIYSKEDLTLNGNGSLTVVSPAGHGIVSKDDLVITSGNYTIESMKNAIAGKDSVRIADGNFTITAGKDGIHADNDDDESLGYLYVEDGSFVINATEKGVFSNSLIQITGGNFNVTSKDDSVHTNGSAYINGGTILLSSGDDGIHADNTLVVTGGSLQVASSYEGLEGETIDISGGVIDITASDDGINAAGGNDSSGFALGG